MTQNDFEKFAEMLSAVAGLYSKEISEMTISIYFNAMKEYDFSAVRQAFDRYVKNTDTGQFMPKPADLIRMMTGTSLDSAMEAWAKVDKAVRQVGTYASVIFDDPLIHRAIADIGGWVNLGTKTDDEWPFVARDFQNIYKGYSNRRENPEYDPVLTGISDLHNCAEGLKKTEPKLIGDSEKARKVMQGGTSTRLEVTTIQQVLTKFTGAAQIETNRA